MYISSHASLLLALIAQSDDLNNREALLRQNNYPTKLNLRKQPNRISSKRRRKIRTRLIFEQRGLCYYCGTRVVISYNHPKAATLDHKVPLSLGGTNKVYKLVMACRSCNGAKGCKSEKRFKSEMDQDRADT